jgi:hypothetical protein
MMMMIIYLKKLVREYVLFNLKQKYFILVFNNNNHLQLNQIIVMLHKIFSI